MSSDIVPNTMAKRYVATIDLQSPEHGVVIDEEGERFARFGSLESAKKAATLMNYPPEGIGPLEDDLFWCSTVTGEEI